ncbi:MAG: ABC transporter permease [Desulfarculaceae bacterium]|nr:ABC transporter permease [Desulfarculaceae bacterium]MCF8046327.1 ABC transporter permease [Desulfarculaceae bacterium]MCF8063697.1 ABC transporter permease [Desulfarculaceae bacterium]MCF8098329.1 ABC transporter permease [Desulfarculaceae bacterium]MCF8121605.1 ABC transporter permease [Desulfarculaceae bacterium]
MSLAWRLLKAAVSSLWAFRSYAALMMIGLIIGIASLTVIHQIGQGAQQAVSSRMASMGFGADAFYISSGGGRLGVRRGMKRAVTLTPQDAASISRVDGVAHVVPHKNVARTQVTAGGNNTNTRVRGATPGWAAARKWPLLQGRFVSLTDIRQSARVAVLGTTVVRELFGEANPVGRRLRIGRTPFIVVGVLESKGSSGWRDRDDIILVPLSTATKRLSRDDKLSGMRVTMTDATRLEEVKAEVTSVLRENHSLLPGVPDDFLIITPDELMKLITRQSRSLVAMLTFVSAVSLFVSGVVIMNIMLVAVSERAYEIGVRRAVGARRRDILYQILMESLMVAAAGGVCGLLMGLLLSYLATWLLAIPTAFSPSGFLWALGFSAGVGLLFGVAPAKKAAGLHPVEALR